MRRLLELFSAVSTSDLLGGLALLVILYGTLCIGAVLS